MSCDVAIRVVDLSKAYQIYERPIDRLKQLILPRLSKLLSVNSKKYFDEYYVHENISFEIKKGETVGIIGRNGSGKSTLLQMISGTLNPTRGNITINGKIAALLELGSGFNPDFTGRENIKTNGVLLGMSLREIENKFDEILAFADIGEFIDQPIKTYSSGMLVRLAFSVIAHVDADILIIDEALAVGDIFFTQKCMRYIRNFQNKGGTILFVSHDTGAVLSLCSRTILLKYKSTPLIGDTQSICKIYIEDLYGDRERDRKFHINEISNPPNVSKGPECRPSDVIALGGKLLIEGINPPNGLIYFSEFNKKADFFGTGAVQFNNIWFENVDGRSINQIECGTKVSLCFSVVARKDIALPVFGFIIKDYLGQKLIAESTDLFLRNQNMVLKRDSISTIKFQFIAPVLMRGEYALTAAVAEGLGDDHIQHCWIDDAMVVTCSDSRLAHGFLGLQGLKILAIQDGK